MESNRELWTSQKVSAPQEWCVLILEQPTLCWQEFCNLN
ncbi:hypothetical protein AM1_H0090 (plasmid) [Acaryochloris marina MBIC11017]|uniref:Uncharacterized protein n=1 Tax=Acaryochloris marina (strain MBIC 11017) TaxID=329726 RepID=A8ZR04_ACAM1|nr:hypothetical protein AM1_H0090 [Acaryochloris marina MBIC11017]